MTKKINILLVTKDHQHNFKLSHSDNILYTSSIAMSLRIAKKNTIDIVIINTKNFSANFNILNYINHIDSFIKNNYYIMIITKRDIRDNQEKFNSNTYILYDFNNKDIVQNNIQNQIILIKKLVTLTYEERPYINILEQTKKQLLLVNTLHSINALIKEDLNKLSIKNGKQYLDNKLDENNTKKSNFFYDVEAIIQNIKKRLDRIDLFCTSNSENNLIDFVDSIEGMLKLNFTAFQFSFKKNINTKKFLIYSHIYTVLSLLFIHIINTKNLPTENVLINISTKVVEKKLYIILKFNIDNQLKFNNSIFVEIAKTILLQKNQRLYLIENKNGYTFIIKF